MSEPVKSEPVKSEPVKSELVFGFYDTVDRCWIGDDNGPRLFGDLLIATVGARILDVQFGYVPGRIRARPYLEKANRLRDHVDTKMGPLEALKRLESGAA